MTNLERDIKFFLLKYLLTWRDKPVPDGALKDAIRSAFMQVAMTAGDLKQYVTECEAAGWIAGTNDELLGLVWLLTPKGKIRAQEL